jgi:hypothetical protein
MKNPKQPPKFGALVPTGKRIDHPEDITERKQRELGAAFNRMSSSNDAEAHSAFDRAREITHDLRTTFDAMWKEAQASKTLHAINGNLGKQLKRVMQENAKYRAMHISYKIKGQIILIGKLAARLLIWAAPVIAVAILFELGIASGSGAAILMLLIGLYHAVKGLIVSSGQRTLIGTILIFASIIAASVISDMDAPYLRRHEAALMENMNRDQDLGPKTFTINYPISRLSVMTTIFGTRDEMKVTVDGVAEPLDIVCAKYYQNSITVPRDQADKTPAPESPDIFHTDPSASFGPCDLYAKLHALPKEP